MTEGQPNVLWAGVESNPALFGLHHSTASALNSAIGFQPEKRPYSPHVTLARLNAPASLDIVDRYVEDNVKLELSAIPIKYFGLCSSIFVDGSPRYQEEELFDLM
jgi:2'-5' RNA ligase